VDTALVNGELKFRLDGVKLKGSWVLVRTHSDGYPEGRTWLLIKHRDEWSGEIDITEKAPDSVKSFGDFADILAKDKPDVWESHRPAKGGAAGQMLAEIIEEAARLKLARKPAGRKRSGHAKHANGNGNGSAKRGAASRPRAAKGRTR
jgi:bifunctional non-homologous end joining protein LigD